MTARRRIAVITGTRADFGLLLPLCRLIHDDPATELQLIATGMHLAPEFGNTIAEVEASGLPVARRVEILLAGDTGVSVSKSVGLGTIGFADAFAELQPDILVLLGDRFEILAAATAATMARIPIAHIHGGEATEGLIDEPIRHAVTKMSQLHFPAAEPYRRRIVQMGEHPDRVFNVGAPAVDVARSITFLEQAALEDRLAIRMTQPLFVVTYHPTTLQADANGAEIEPLLDSLAEWPQATIIITGVNADMSGRAIRSRLDAWTAVRKDHVRIVSSLGQQAYYSLLRLADVVIGNSSSGIIEAPLFGLPTVDIGDRQRGRLRGPSILHAPADATAISGAIRIALEPGFRKQVTGTENPYGDGHSATATLSVLKSVALGSGLLMKSFYDQAAG